MFASADNEILPQKGPVVKIINEIEEKILSI